FLPTTTFGANSITVTGMSRPVSSKTWVMPVFLPISPIIPQLLALNAAASVCRMLAKPGRAFTASQLRRRPLLLDLHVDAGGQLQLHERVHDIGRRIDDIDQALVRPHFELLPRFLVNVGRAKDRVLVDARGQGDGN